MPTLYLLLTTSPTQFATFINGTSSCTAADTDQLGSNCTAAPPVNRNSSLPTFAEQLDKAVQQGPPATAAFFNGSAVGQSLLARAKQSALARSADGAGRAAAGIAAGVAEKLAGPLQNLTSAFSGLTGTVARSAANAGLKSTVAVAEAAEPLIGLGVNASRGLAEPIAAAGQRLAARSFEGLVRQVEALPDAGERERAMEALRPRLVAEQGLAPGGSGDKLTG